MTSEIDNFIFEHDIQYTFDKYILNISLVRILVYNFCIA